MTVFDEVKAALSMKTVAESCGLSVSRSGMVLCPFHKDKTPSAKIYRDIFHCFGCGVHVNVIGFVQRFFELKRPIDAVRKLDADFHLQLGLSGERILSDVREYRARQARRQEYEKWEQEAWLTLSSYYRLLLGWRELAPKSPNEKPDERFIYALHHLDKAEYLCEEFITADEEVKKSMAEAVKQAADFIRAQRV